MTFRRCRHRNQVHKCNQRAENRSFRYREIATVLRVCNLIVRDNRAGVYGGAVNYL